MFVWTRSSLSKGFSGYSSFLPSLIISRFQSIREMKINAPSTVLTLTAELPLHHLSHTMCHGLAAYGFHVLCTIALWPKQHACWRYFVAQGKESRIVPSNVRTIIIIIIITTTTSTIVIIIIIIYHLYHYWCCYHHHHDHHQNISCSTYSYKKRFTDWSWVLSILVPSFSWSQRQEEGVWNAQRWMSKKKNSSWQKDRENRIDVTKMRIPRWTVLLLECLWPPHRESIQSCLHHIAHTDHSKHLFILELIYKRLHWTECCKCEIDQLFAQHLERNWTTGEAALLDSQMQEASIPNLRQLLWVEGQ